MINKLRDILNTYTKEELEEISITENGTLDFSNEYISKERGLQIQISAREEEYRKLENNWNKLKKWLEDYIKLLDNPDTYEEQTLEDLKEVIDKMQEIERSVRDVED